MKDFLEKYILQRQNMKYLHRRFKPETAGANSQKGLWVLNLSSRKGKEEAQENVLITYS